jgi:hypothetical protein
VVDEEDRELGDQGNAVRGGAVGGRIAQPRDDDLVPVLLAPGCYPDWASLFGEEVLAAMNAVRRDAHGRRRPWDTPGL